jgi:hypothetical protein
VTEVEELQREIRAICQREAFFAAQGKLGDMIPWGDLSGEDRKEAIEFYGWEPGDAKRTTHRSCPDCKGVGVLAWADGTHAWCGLCKGTGGIRVEVNI